MGDWYATDRGHCRDPNRCEEECYFGSQLFLLLPIHIFGRLLQVMTHRLLTTFISVRTDRLGLLSDFKRLYSFGFPLLLTTYLLVVLMDLGVLDTDPVGHLALSATWIAVLGWKFTVM